MKKYFCIILPLCLCGTFQYNAWAMEPRADDDSDGERLDLHQGFRAAPRFSFNPADLQRAQERTPIDGVKHLENANLNGADLSRLDLHNANLTGAKLNGANLSCTNLSGAILDRTELRGAILDRTILANANIIGSDFSNAQISNVVLSQVHIRDYVREVDNTHFATKFIGATIKDMYIWDSEISNSDFTNSKMLGIRIAASKIENVNMRNVTIEEIVIAASFMKNVSLIFAHINKIFIQNCPIIGGPFTGDDLAHSYGLDLSYATISTGEIRGGIILSTSTEARTDGITEMDQVSFKHTLLINAMFTPVMLVTPVGGTLSTLAYLHRETRINEYRELYGISNINSILLRSNFHGATISDVRFSNIKFGDCTNIQNIKMAFGCLLENVVSSDPQDLATFKDKGAKVNGEFSPVFEYMWKGTDYDGFLKRLTLEAVPGFARGVVGL